MNENISTDTARIRALKSSMVSLLEHEDGVTISVNALSQGASLLSQAYQNLLNLGSKQLVRVTLGDFRGTLQAVQAAYADWRDVDAAFANTFDLAYAGSIDHRNLLLDTVHTDLKQRVGDPISALYTRLHGTWSEHLEGAPWDEFMAPDVRDANTARLNAGLKSLVHGDHLDVEDALEGLTDPLRHAFAHYLETRTESLELLEESLWMRPEIVVMNDFWRYNPTVRILEILQRKATRRAGAFSRIQDFFTTSAPGVDNTSAAIKSVLKDVPQDQRDPFMRCLLLHPNQDIRRYAANNCDVEAFWKLATPRAVPCATILTLLERIGSPNYNEGFQKVFFQTVHRRLLSATSRSDVVYTRGIARIFSRLPFFLEDSYFEPLMRVVDYVTAKERMYQLGDGVLSDYIADLKHEKRKLGTLRTDAPTLTSIPPVVLRKLARDGHFWYELSMHPMYKIARETIPHVNTEARALRLTNNHMASQDVLRAVGRNRSLYKTLPAKMSLLANPRTPIAVSLAYVNDLTKSDCEKLLRKSTVHPELRTHLRRRLNA